MSSYIYRNGSRLTPYMAYQIERLNADVKKLFGVEVVVTSGIRLHQEQIDIFLYRYVTAANIRGRKVYDTRVWNGVRYYRISSYGTVAVPGTSNHEIQGDSAAVDLRDTGYDAGIATWGSARSNWLRSNCWKYAMEPEGFNFNEAWHYKTVGIFRPVPQDEESRSTKVMKHYHIEDYTSRAGSRVLEPGKTFWLNREANAPVNRASNVVGEPGAYTLTLHVYAEGKPGDVLEAQLFWDNTKVVGPNSGHYTERMVFDKDGKINHSVTSQRTVPNGYAVYGNLRSPLSNEGDSKITLFDSDAYLFN